MRVFNNLKQLSEYSYSSPFYKLQVIGYRAEEILLERTQEQHETAAATIEKKIADYKDVWLKEQIERYIRRISEEGGWELAYLPYDSVGSEQEIQDLLNNWPSDAADFPTLPVQDDLNDLNVLNAVLESGYPYGDVMKSPSATRAEIYALLALIKIDRAIETLKVKQRRTANEFPVFTNDYPWKVQDAIKAANYLIEAMEIICYAERELLPNKFYATSNAESQILSLTAGGEARKNNARRAASMRHASSNEARDFVEEQWNNYRHEYGDNKSAFARDYTKRVWNEYGVQIGVRQMCEVWLADPRSASKPDG